VQISAVCLYMVCCVCTRSAVFVRGLYMACCVYTWFAMCNYVLCWQCLCNYVLCWQSACSYVLCEIFNSLGIPATLQLVAGGGAILLLHYLGA